jgi:hypothetical protein
VKVICEGNSAITELSVSLSGNREGNSLQFKGSKNGTPEWSGNFFTAFYYQNSVSTEAVYNFLPGMSSYDTHHRNGDNVGSFHCLVDPSCSRFVPDSMPEPSIHRKMQ